MLSELVRAKLEALPPSPGVYVFKDRAGQVLYVGKAGSLRNRVRGYFQASSSDQRFFIERHARRGVAQALELADDLVAAALFALR